MAKKPRENRVPIMMSDDELAQIDDWRFGNRVATRSDAIRRLCQMALSLDKKLTPLYESLGDIASTISDISGITENITNNIDSITKKDISNVIYAQGTLNIKLSKHYLLMRSLTANAYNYKKDDNIINGMDEADDIEKFFKEQIEKMNDIISKYTEIKKRIT
jgi:hypothetical protein